MFIVRCIRCCSLFLAVSFILCTLASCMGKTEDKEPEQKSEGLANQFKDEGDDAVSQSSGMIGYGFADGSPDEYTYNGEAVEIPYYIENMGEAGEENAEVGLLLFVDGEAQPFSVYEKEEKTEEAVMQKFSIPPGERMELTLSFFPVSGKKGETIGIIPATIWNPDFVPESGENPVFGNCLKLGANIPLTIQMEADGNKAHKGAQTDTEMMDIPEEILAENEIFFGEGEYDSLDSSVGFTIEPTKEKTNLLTAENGRADITMNLYGGKQVTDKITVFVNNEPVKIDGGDYVKVKTKKGRMWQIRFSLDVSNYKDMNTIYAVAMTSGEDYKVSDIYQSNILLLAKDAQGTENAEKETKEPKFEETTEAGSGEYFYLDYNYENNCLELTDLGNRKAAASIRIGKKEDIMAVFNCENGYAAAKQKLRKKRKAQYVKGIYIPDDTKKTKKNVAAYELILYDKDLKEVSKTDMLDALCGAGGEEVLGEKPVMNCAGTKIAWISAENKVFYMDLKTGQCRSSEAFLKEGIEVKQISFTGDDKLAFIADEGETDTRYGYLDLEKEKLISFTEHDYQASELHTDGQYICVNDVHDPYTNSSSGKVLVLDCETNEHNAFKVDGLESTHAVVTADGGAVIAAKQLNNHAFRVRKYDYETGEKSYEKEVSKTETIKPAQIMRFGEKYIATYMSDSGRGYACEIGVN